MNFFFESNFVNLHGHGLLALTHAVASENSVSLIILGCSGRSRPGQIHQRLFASRQAQVTPCVSCTSPRTEAMGRSKYLPRQSRKEPALCGLWAPAEKPAASSQLPLSALLELQLAELREFQLQQPFWGPARNLHHKR